MLNFCVGAFKNNVLLAARTGLGVLIASVVQTRKKVGGAEYMFLPSTYYLGGLTYATTSVIFSAGRNLGGTLREAWESLCGVGIALLFNVLLFAAGMEITGKDLTMYSHFSLASENIVVSNVDIQTFYPIILVYTFVILLAPLQTGTKKFAIGMNLFFLLRLLNPNNPDGSDGIKDTTNPDNESNLFTVENILERFLMYSAVGAWGCFVAVLMILVPYPIIAMRQMQIVIKQAHAELHDLLNVLIDVFATFKVHEKVNGDIAQMDLILEMKIEKMLAKCDNRLADMVELIDCIWWEQLFGLNLILKINKVVYKLYVRMYQGLLVHLHEMYKGVKNKHRQSKSDQSQVQIYRNIRKQLYKVQSIAAQHFQDITAHVCVSDIHMRLPRTPALENALSKLNKSLKAQAKTILEMDEITSSMSSIEGKHRRNMHVFLFHFISICEILKSFEKQFKTKHFGTRYRTWHFICRALGTAFDKKHYTWSHVLAAFKITTAIAIGLLPAIFVYGYSATTPSAIAYVMSRNLTGSYNTTMDRVLGVVAGSIVPSIFKFFISHISTYWTQLLVNNLFLFCWVTMSVYVFFSSPSHFYAGQVSAFIAAAILLRPILIFQPGDSLSETTSKELLASYMGLMETSMGLLILVVVELLFYPRSSITLLRVNMQQSLQNLSSCFTLSTKAIVSSNPIKPSDKNPKELRKMIDNTLPALLDKQKDLLQGAQVEPSLWRPKFSSTKYNYICKDCTTLFNNIKSISILIYGSENIQTNNGFTPIIESTERDALLHWCSTIPWPRIIHEGFSSMSLLLDPKHLFSPTDDTAVYLQMKEAFHAGNLKTIGTYANLTTSRPRRRWHYQHI